MAKTDEGRRPFTVHIASDGNGIHSVHSTVEPVFCFFCSSEEEAFRLAKETWEDYVVRFGQREERRATSENVTIRQLTRTRELAIA